MFRLHFSGLPADPIFPHDMKELGYFINDDDEIRAIKNPDQYFNFFLSKNERINAIQREAMNACIRTECLTRLRRLDFHTIRLPLGSSASVPNVPILVSDNLSTAKRVVLLFYEHNQDLGIFAQRVVGGKGGINAGSCINMVKYLQTLATSSTCPSPPGMIIANLGQLRWWRKGQQALTQTSWYALPARSAVSGSFRFDDIANTIPDNRDTQEHVKYVFDHVVSELCLENAVLDMIGVSDGAVQVVEYLDRNFEKWGEQRLGAVALCTPFHTTDDIHNNKFMAWLKKRGRAYVTSTEPANVPLSGSAGTKKLQGYGCPIYSIGEPYYSELMLVKGHRIILDWFQEVHNDENGDYSNPEVVVFEADDDDADATWKGGELDKTSNPEEKSHEAGNAICPAAINREDSTIAATIFNTAAADAVDGIEKLMLDGDGEANKNCSEDEEWTKKL